MSAIQALKDEHRVIEQVLACLEKMAERSERDGRLDAAAARDAIDFFRNFADRCHHGKEEHQLFPMMESRGLPPQGGPTAVMRSEHVQGRELIGAMAASIEGAGAGRAGDVGGFAAAARGYALLLREHINKEEHVLFPMAEQILGASGLGELAVRFEHVESEDMGSGVHESYLAKARALADRFGVTPVAVQAGPCGCGHR